MVAFARATDLPTNIDTLEKLAMWLIATFRATYGTRSVVEVEGLLPERQTQMSFIESPSGETYCVMRIAVKLDPLFVADKSKKQWEFAQEGVTSAIPAPYKVN
ncbi:MAG: hypothetical protein RLZZ511_1027 [Cyanobacteriota bacterium]|jgi:hypothetical protein